MLDQHTKLLEQLRKITELNLLYTRKTEWVRKYQLAKEEWREAKDQLERDGNKGHQTSMKLFLTLDFIVQAGDNTYQFHLGEIDVLKNKIEEMSGKVLEMMSDITDDGDDSLLEKGIKNYLKSTESVVEPGVIKMINKN